MRLDRISIRILDNKLAYRPIERLMELAEKRERGVNFLVVEAILRYLKREEET